MYQFSYAEIMEEGVAVSKDRERQVLDRSIALLKAAMTSDGGNQSRQAIEAIYFTRRVWLRFIEDLGDPENQLEAELRANLISIAIWILKEVEKIRKRESSNFQGIIDITTIGAGGGSIASVTPSGALKVGPQSAGADPGPASYGKGGEMPTVTDANLVLGRLPETLAGGALALDTEAAREAVRQHIAGPLGLSIEEAAMGIIRIVDEHMLGALRVVSVQRGQVRCIVR